MAKSDGLVAALAAAEISDVRKHIVSCYEPSEKRKAALDGLEGVLSLLKECEPLDVATDESESLAEEIVGPYAAALKQLRASMLLIGA